MRLYTATITIKNKEGGTTHKLKPQFILLESQENIFDNLDLLYDKSRFSLHDYHVKEETVYRKHK